MFVNLNFFWLQLFLLIWFLLRRVSHVACIFFDLIGIHSIFVSVKANTFLTGLTKLCPVLVHFFILLFSIVMVVWRWNVVHDFCQNNTKTFRNSFKLRFINGSITKVLTFLALHFVHSQVVTDFVNILWNCFFLHFYVKRRPINSEWDFEISENGGERVGADVAMKFGLDFSSHVGSTFTFFESFAEIMDVKIVAVLSHLIKTVFNDIRAIFRPKDFLLAVLDGYFEHSECLESTDGVVSKVLTLIFIIIVWVGLFRVGFVWFFISFAAGLWIRELVVHDVFWLLIWLRFNKNTNICLFSYVKLRLYGIF